jgi:hypothetical protein
VHLLNISSDLTNNLQTIVISCTLYADVTSTIVTDPSFKDFKINTNKVFLYIHEWFKASLLSLNLKKLITYNLGQNIVMKLISNT